MVRSSSSFAKPDNHKLHSEEPRFIHRAHPHPPIHPFPGFRRGNLLRVEMKNFLTFTHTTIAPGPRINLIIGPNGTGKSTIANAVCIAFGGHPRLLGRNPDLGGFVKHGTQQAQVSALIYDDTVSSGVRSISRTFDTDGRTEFTLDGKRCTMAKIVSDVCERYDIQLDNLSQFMPQEKIAEFVNLQPDELLTITIRSLGGTPKATKFEDLKKIDKLISQNDFEVTRLEEKLSQLNEQQQANAEEVAAYRQQQAIRHKLNLYRRYLLCAEEDYARERYAALLKQRKELEKKLNDAKSIIREASAGPLNAKIQQLDAARDALKSAKEASNTYAVPLEQLSETVEEMNGQLRSKHAEFRDAEHRTAQLEKAVTLAKGKFETAKEDKDNMDNIKIPLLDNQIKEIEEKKKNVRRDIARHDDSASEWERQRQEASRNIKISNHQLQQFSDVRQLRIDNLTRWKRKPLDRCAELVSRLSQSGAFRGAVYGPVGAEIEVKSEYHSKIMEHVMRGDFFITAFVTETMRDANVLLQECQRELHWRPNVFTSPTTVDDQPDAYAIQNQVPVRPIDDELRSLGVVDVVSNIYKAPPAVRAALNAQLNLHCVHVGTESAASRGSIDTLKWKSKMIAWYTPTARIQIIRSRYDEDVRNVSMDNSFENQTGRFFSESLVAQGQQRQLLIAQIREEEGKMSNALERIKAEKDSAVQLMEVKRSLETQRRDKEKVKMQVKKSHDIVRSLQRQVDQAEKRARSHDVKSLKTALTEEMAMIEKDLLDKISKLSQKFEKQANSIARCDDTAVKVACSASELALEQQKHESAERELVDQENACKEKKSEEKAAKSDYKQKLERAKGVIAEKDWEEQGEVLTAIHQLTPAELEEKIAQMEGQEQGLRTGGGQVLAKFEHRARMIDEATRELEERNDRQGKKKRKLQGDKNEFLVWLNDGISKMRVKFSSLYRRLGCSGDLELINTESEKLSDLALQILVSYREDVALRPISTSSNSGGEKMCCTMLFCFSLLLEEERMPPFVFVDELNQGLDPTNEMKIMTMMFEDAEKETSPQSFVISPKMLLNMPLKTQTKTHIIFNGMVRGKDEILAPVHS